MGIEGTAKHWYASRHVRGYIGIWTFYRFSTRKERDEFITLYKEDKQRAIPITAHYISHVMQWNRNPDSYGYNQFIDMPSEEEVEGF